MQHTSRTMNGSIGQNGDAGPSSGFVKASSSDGVAILDGEHTPQNVALYAFALGAMFGGSFAVACYSTTIPQLAVFLAVLAIFHMAEYLLTALFNPDKLGIDAFLINNGAEYHIAHGSGIVEFLIEWYFFPEFKNGFWPIRYFGLTLVVIGQIVRTLAMWHAKSNFSHKVQRQKRADHELVTTGIYAYLRHPSYFGFYYWAPGTQIFLLNPICTVGFAVVLRKFFRERIREEERLLVIFFGKEYEEYRRRVPVGIVP